MKWQAAASGLETREDSYDEILDPNALTLGFARRFTEYKRPTLLLTDPDRLARILNLESRPVQLIIAGKAHPNDYIGKEMIRKWFAFLKRPDVFGKVVFIQDYDMMVAKKLVQGVDLWINNPRRPWEASGTSGMKLLVNGGLNLSELDGWWAEAYGPEVGWALGDGKEHDTDPEWDRREAFELYDRLENEVIPAFYQRDETGIPRSWVAMMKASMSRLTPEFSSNRMLRDYVEKYYIPAANSFVKRSKNNGEIGEKIFQWQKSLERHWKNIYFGNLEYSRQENSYVVRVQVYLDGLSPDMVDVQCYAEPKEDGDGPEIHKMEPKEPLKGAINGYLYHAEFVSDRPFSDYTPRIIPRCQEAMVPLENKKILWLK